MYLTAFAWSAEAVTLEEAIQNGLTNALKYARWGALAILAAVFCWAFVEKTQNKDNHAVAANANKIMWATGLGFVVVATYRMMLEGFIQMTGADPSIIPVWIWKAG